MRLSRRKGILVAVIVPALIAGLLFTAGCTGQDRQALEGILQNISSINGTINFTTNDGQNHVLTIDNKTQFTFDGQTVALEALAPGAKLEIELGDNRTLALRVKARLDKVAGTIASFQDGELSVIPQRGGAPVTVSVNATTQIKAGDNVTASVDLLKPGARVEVKYDPATKVALTIFVNIGEEANIQGTVIATSDNRVTVQDRKERVLTFIADNTTRITNGTLADIKVGSRVEARFDPVSMVAVKITLLGNTSRDNEKENRGNSENRTNEGNANGRGQKTQIAPNVPHTLVGRADCLTCHQASQA